MAQHIVADGTHILGDDIAAAMYKGVRTRRTREVDAGTGRTAETNHRLEVAEPVLLGVTRSEHNINDILLYFLVEIDLVDHGTRFLYILGGEDRQHLFFLARNVLTDNLLLLFFLGIADDNLEHKTVGLRLGQRVSTLLFDRVLRGEHEERVAQLECLLTDGYLSLLHRLEQGGLHLCGRTVYLVRQYEIREDRAFLDVEFLGLLRVDLRAEYIGRQQIGRKLNTGEVGFNQIRQGLDSQGFCQARYAFEQDMSVAQKTDKQALDQVFLPYDDLIHTEGQGVYEGTLTLDAFLQFPNIYCGLHSYVCFCCAWAGVAMGGSACLRSFIFAVPSGLVRHCPAFFGIANFVPKHEMNTIQAAYTNSRTNNT